MNEYGLDVSYFKGKLSLILRDVANYTPDEMYRELTRMASVLETLPPASQAQQERIKLTPMSTEESPRQWFFDCDDLYIDVEHLNGEVSIFVKNRSNNATGWKELIEKPSEEKCVQCGV